MPLPIVRLTVEKHYRVELESPILSGISWTIEAGQHWALVGENGSGKSTLLSILSGALWPSRGSVSVFGEDYGSVDKRILRKRIGVVSSILFAAFPGYDTALDVAASGLDARIGRLGPLTDEEKLRGQRALERLSAIGCAHKRYGVLSQGERQRVMIARALVNDPALLILDEPCGGLDPVARERFLGDLGRLAAAPDGPTQVHVTHHLEEIPDFVTHALLLKEGRALAQGPIDEVLTNEWLSRAFDARCRVTRHGDRTRRFRLEIDLS